MTLNELRAKRAEAWNSAKKFLEEKCGESGLLSAEDDAAYSKMEQQIEDYSKEIARLEKLEALNNEMSKPLATPIVNTPSTAMGIKTGRASDEYKAAMMDAFRSGFKSVSDVLKEGSDKSGGYLVPEELDNRLIEALDGENIVRKLATVIRTEGEHKINLAAVKPTAAWIDEGETLDFPDLAEFDRMVLDAYKLMGAVKVTNELLEDNAFGLENWIVNSFAKVLAAKEEDAFLNGDGEGKPTGIFAETGGGTAAISVDENSKTLANYIIDLVYKLKRQYRSKAAFIMSDKTVARIRKLKDGDGRFLWEASFTAGEPDRLLGYPLYTSEYAPDNKIAFGDYSYYNIGDRGTRSFKRLDERFADSDTTGFTIKERVDGKLILPEAVQILTLTTTTTESAA